jgi:hypothetical protein
MRDLAERPVTFEYRYNVTCLNCPAITTLTSAEYFREANKAHASCAACASDIHFGPAVMTLRDPGDQTLDDAHLIDVA